MDSLSSLQLYTVIVGITTVFTMALFEVGGSGGGAGGMPQQQPLPRRASTASVTTAAHLPHPVLPVDDSIKQHQQHLSLSSSARSNSEPKWYLFKYVNAAAVMAFLAIVVHFALYPDQGWYDALMATIFTTALWTESEAAVTAAYSLSPLLQFIVAWSIFVVYCFGFFGVSLVYDLLRTVNNVEQPSQDAMSTTANAARAQNQHGHRSANQQRHAGEDSAHADDVAIPSSISVPNGPIPPVPLAGSSMPSDSSHNEHGLCENYPLPSDGRTGELSSSLSTSNADATTSETNDTASDDWLELTANLVLQNKLKDHELERVLDPFRAVQVRRSIYQYKLATNATLDKASAPSTSPLDALPYQHSLDYSRVYGSNCESVVGFLPIPVGLVGPLRINDEWIYVPMATTEGCLVASTNRGCKAISESIHGGAWADVVRDGISRAPCLRLPSACEAARVKAWCEVPSNFTLLQQAFESTTAFGKLTSCSPTIAGRNLYLRLVCFAGDAMGMNMVSKGSLAVIECLKRHFDQLQLVALSGNMCSDKKAAAINWIEGRGKSVVVEATIDKSIVHSVLKTTVSAMVYTNLHKNLIGSAMAGMATGGFNAHAANVVAAIFLATGQDPAQTVESSNCITLLEETDDGDLWMSCTMPSIEVGTVGGGTGLDAQAACLRILNCQGSSSSSSNSSSTNESHETHKPGYHAQRLAKIIAATTMAGELSLLAALAANTLVEAHLQHNRKTASA